MPDEPTEEQNRAYSALRTRGLDAEDERAMMESIGILPDRERTLNGHEYPIFQTGGDYARYLRYGMTWDRHMQHDIDVWYETIQTSSPLVKSTIMIRVFTVLKLCDFRWKRGNREGFADPNDYGHRFAWSLASALSHGSRVCFVIPKATHGGFREWLSAGSMGSGWNSSNAIGTRSFNHSTHDGWPVRTTDRRVDVKEIKVGGVGNVTRGWHAYGMNLAMGRRGDPSPVQGRTLSDDGSCGHLFVFESNVFNLGSFFSPEKYKIMMVGLEASASGTHDLYGSAHGMGQEQRGTGVSIYWHKNERGGNYIGMDNLPGSHRGFDDLPAKYGGMVIHLNVALTELRNQARRVETGSSGSVLELLEYVPSLGGRPVPPPPPLPPPPPPEPTVTTPIGNPMADPAVASSILTVGEPDWDGES